MVQHVPKTKAKVETAPPKTKPKQNGASDTKIHDNFSDDDDEEDEEGAIFCKGCDIEFEGYSNFINHLKVGTPCWKEHRPPWPDPPLPVAHQTKWAPPWRPRTGKSICFVFALGRFCVYLFGIMKKCNLFARTHKFFETNANRFSMTLNFRMIGPTTT